jgi:hypothetical protein
MICNGKPPAAEYIELWNQYCKINQAWIEAYVALVKFYIPQK